MKLYQIATFSLTIVSIICSDELGKRSTNDEQELNQEEYYGNDGEFVDKYGGYEDKFGYKTKKYFPPESKVPMQYMIIKRTREIPANQKYLMAHSSTEMTTYHNKKPMKIAYTIAHKPKIMPMKIVQQGSVKHIYIDMPDLFENGNQKNYGNLNQAASNIHYQHNAYNPGQYKQNYYQQSVQYAPTDTGIAKGSIDFEEINPQIQGYVQKYPTGYGSNIYSSVPKTFGNPGDSQFAPSFSHQQFPQFSADGKERYMYVIPDQFKSLFTNNAYTSNQYNQPQKFPQNGATNFPYQQHYDLGKAATGNNFVYQQSFDMGKIVDGEQFANEQSYDLAKTVDTNNFDYHLGKSVPSNNFGNQETFDLGKAASGNNFAYEQSHELGKTVDGNDFAKQTSHNLGKIANDNTFAYQQSNNLGEKASDNNFAYQKPYTFQETDAMSKISGFNPNLVNILNDVLNKEEGHTTSDEFKKIESSDKKPIYMIGKPGTFMTAVPTLASYSFPTNSDSGETQTSSRIKFFN